MTTGTITVSGVSEKQLADLIEFKIAHQGKFIFNPVQAQQQATQAKPPQQPSFFYNNVIISWNDDAGLKVVIELLLSLLSEPRPGTATLPG